MVIGWLIGWSVGFKGLVLAAVVGGFIVGSKIQITCLKCGHSWLPESENIESIEVNGPEGLNSFKWGHNNNINIDQIGSIGNNPDLKTFYITSGNELLVYGHKALSIQYFFYVGNLYEINVYLDTRTNINVAEDIKRQLINQYGRNYTENASVTYWKWPYIDLNLSNDTLKIVNHMYEKK
jgi:hypothetical protein